MENQREHTMVVSGFGSTEVVPDGAWLDASVEITDPSPATAYRQVGVVVDRVVEALDAAGVGAADRQTRAIALMPQMTFDGTEHVLAGYTANHAMRLRIRGVPAISAVLDVLVEVAGDALRLQHDAVTLAGSGTAEARALAEAAAVADAHDRALRLAEAAGVALGPVLSVREETLPGRYQPATAPGWRQESTGGAVQAGVDTLTAAVRVTFALRQ